MSEKRQETKPAELVELNHDMTLLLEDLATDINMETENLYFSATEDGIRDGMVYLESCLRIFMIQTRAASKRAQDYAQDISKCMETFANYVGDNMPDDEQEWNEQENSNEKE